MTARLWENSAIVNDKKTVLIQVNKLNFVYKSAFLWDFSHTISGTSIFHHKDTKNTKIEKKSKGDMGIIGDVEIKIRNAPEARKGRIPHAFQFATRDVGAIVPLVFNDPNSEPLPGL